MKFIITASRFCLQLALVSLLGSGAAYGEWQINEVFTSADGKVQFVELQTAASSDNNLNGQILFSSSLIDNNWSAPERSFIFDRNLTGDTTNKSILLATQHFTDRTGLVPDFFIPEKFLPATDGKLRLGNLDELTIVKEQLPKNGTQSIDGEGTPQTATPTNFAGETSGVAIPPVATVDLEARILTVPVVDAPGFGVAYLTFDIDFSTLEFTLRDDYFLFAEGIEAGTLPALFQNGNSLYVPNLSYENQLVEFRLSLTSGDPVTFGSIEILNTFNELPVLNPDPDTNWFISEFFTNVDGSIQFVELFTYGNEEQNLAGLTLVSDGNRTTIPVVTFTFPENLDGPTANKSVLLATEGFEDDTGLTADFILPDNFIPIQSSPISLILTFNEGKDRLRSNGNIIPVNGFQSSNRLKGTGIATPTNFSGQTTTVNAESFAVYNEEEGTILLPEIDREGQSMEGARFEVDLENSLLNFRSSWPLKFGILPSPTSAIYTRAGSIIEYYVPKLLVDDQLY